MGDGVEEGRAWAQVLGAARDEDAVDRLWAGGAGRGSQGVLSRAGPDRPLCTAPPHPTARCASHRKLYRTPHTLNTRSTSALLISHVMGTARAPALSTNLT